MNRAIHDMLALQFRRMLSAVPVASEFSICLLTRESSRLENYVSFDRNRFPVFPGFTIRERRSTRNGFRFVLIQFVVQSLQSNTEFTRGFGFVAVVFFKHAENDLHLNFSQSHDAACGN